MIDFSSLTDEELESQITEFRESLRYYMEGALSALEVANDPEYGDWDTLELSMTGVDMKWDVLHQMLTERDRRTAQ